jgi:hypothetical protein
VSIVHSRTKNPEEIIKHADIIISAVGQPNMVRGSWLKPGAVVIDVGINPVEVRKILLWPVVFLSSTCFPGYILMRLAISICMHACLKGCK